MGYGNKNWCNSAYFEDGKLRDDYMLRLEKILKKADEIGMVPIVGLFYFGQDQNLKDEAHRRLQQFDKKGEQRNLQTIKPIVISMTEEEKSVSYES